MIPAQTRSPGTDPPAPVARSWKISALVRRAVAFSPLLCLTLATPPARAQQVIVQGGSCLLFEAFVRADSAQSTAARAYLADFERTHPGIRVQVKDVADDPAALNRLRELSTRFGLKEATVPTFFACGRILVGFRDGPTTGPQLEELFTAHIFIRDGCPRCAMAKNYVAGLQQRTPGLRVAYHEIVRDPNARAWMEQLASWYRVSAASVPAFYMCGQFQVGYNGDGITGAQLEGLVAPYRTNCGPAGAWRFGPVTPRMPALTDALPSFLGLTTPYPAHPSQDPDAPSESPPAATEPPPPSTSPARPHSPPKPL